MKKQYKYKLIYRTDFEIDQSDNKSDLELIKKQLRFAKGQKGELKIVLNKINK